MQSARTVAAPDNGVWHRCSPARGVMSWSLPAGRESSQNEEQGERADAGDALKLHSHRVHQETAFLAHGPRLADPRSIDTSLSLPS